MLNQDNDMSGLQSLLDNLLTTGTITGWRIDAILIAGLLWVLATGSGTGVALVPPLRLAYRRAS
jgi:hypothetical protein